MTETSAELLHFSICSFSVFFFGSFPILQVSGNVIWNDRCSGVCRKNIRRLEWLVLQAPVVRALIIVSDIIAVAEMREEAKT